jgi:predicted ATPase with chaperone activity
VPLRQSQRTRFRLPARAKHRCTADYQARISGPLIDRIDLHIEVPAVTAANRH